MRSRSEERFRQFVFEHQARIRLADWPQLGTEDGEIYWSTIRKHLGDMGASLEIATEASILIAKNPPEWLSQQQGVLLDTARRLVRLNSAPPEFPAQASRPEHLPGPWDATQTIEDLKAFCRSVDAAAGKQGPLARSMSRTLARSEARPLPEPVALPDPDFERERQRQLARRSIAESFKPSDIPVPTDDVDGLF